MSIKVIVFDLGKVLFDFDTKKFAQNISAHSPETAQQILHAVETNIQTFNRYETGHISSQEFYNRAKEFFNYTADYKTFANAWDNMFTPMTASINILKELSLKAHTALLSNTNELHFDYLNSLYPEVFKCFKDLHLSYKMSARKPNAKIYKDVINFYKFKPEEIFFTDDLTVNIEAAKSLGIKAYKFTGAQSLLNALALEGV